MPSEDVSRSASPLSFTGAKGRQPRRQQVEDEPRRHDKTYRRYAAGIQAALASFDTTRLEWPDYISFLGRLLKAVQSHPPAVHDLPHKEIVAQRLAQCLNPALPSGVHQKAIEVYSYIFSLIGKDSLAYDLHVYLPGLSPVLTFASLSLRPYYISLLETHIVPLDGSALRPALRALLLGLLPGLEEENSEEFDRTLQIVDGLKSAVNHDSHQDSERTNVSGQEHFWQCLFLANIGSPSRRQGALAYLQRRLPKFKATSNPTLSEDAEPVISPEPGLLIRCFAAGLGDEQPLLQRGYLDLLLSHLPLDSPVLTQRVTMEDLEHLIAAATGVVARRDMSLNRRLWSWFLGPKADQEAANVPPSPAPVAEETGPPQRPRPKSAYFTEYGSQPLIRSILRTINKPATAVLSRARPFRICLSLMDRSEIGSLIIPHIFLPAMENLLAYKEQATDEDFQEVLRSASSFFDGVESGVIWAQMAHLFWSSLVPDQVDSLESKQKLRLADFVLENFNVREEEMISVHAPLVASLLVGAINSREQQSNMSSHDELLEKAIETLDRLTELLPERGRLNHTSGYEEVDEIEPSDGRRRELLAKITAFYVEHSGNLAESPPPLSPFQIASHLVLEGITLLMAGVKRGCQSRSVLIRAKVLGLLISKLPDSHQPSLQTLLQSFCKALNRFEATSKHVPFAILTAISQVVNQYVVTHPDTVNENVQALSHLVVCLVKHFWYYLSPSYPKFHLESIRSIWQLDDLMPARHTVEASLASMLVSAREPQIDMGPTLETARRFAVLWTHTTANHGSQARRANSVWSKHGGGTPQIGAFASNKEHEQRLNRPLLLLLDASQQTDSALGYFLKDWLSGLPNLDGIFGILVRALQPTIFYHSEGMLHSSQNGAGVQKLHEDCRPESLYYLQHILRLLRMHSSHLWTTLSHRVDTRLELKLPTNTEHTTLKDIIVADCLHIVRAGSELAADAIEEMDVQLQRTALIIIQILLRSPNPARLQQFRLEDALLDVLMRTVESISAHPSLQVAMLDAIAAALELRLAEVVSDDVQITPSSTPTLESSRTFPRAPPTARLDLTSPREVAAKARQANPPAQLIKCLLAGVSSSSSVHALENWVRFLLEVIPLFGDTLFQNLIPLVDCFCTKIRTMFGQLQAVFKEDGVEDATTPETALLALLGGFESILAAGHERLLSEEHRKAISRPPEPAQGFLSNVVSGVFASDTQKSRSAVGNTRLTVILCFQDALQVCLPVWSWALYGEHSNDHDPACINSLGYFSQRLRNRARRLLDRVFGAEALECLEALMVLWLQQGALPQRSRITPVFSLLHVLDSARPKNVMPAIFNSIYSRTNPGAIETSRQSSLTSDLTDVELGQFLIEYTQSLDDDAMDEIWSDCMAFLRDVLTNPLPHHGILPSLLVFLITLAEKVENTNFGEQRRMRRETSELFTRLLSAIFTTRSAGSLQEPAQAMFVGEKLVNGGDGAAGRAARRKSGQVDLIATLNAILPRLPMVFNENERLISVVTSISTNVISPTLHSKSFPENTRPAFLSLLLKLTNIKPASKIWKKDILDAVNNLKFFSSSLPAVRDGWLPLLKQWLEGDKDRVAELCGRIPAPTAAGNIFGVGATAARLDADKKTQFNLRRIACLIMAAEHDFLLSNYAALEEKISELLAATAASSPSSVTRAEIFLVLRAVLLRTSFIHLGSLWPVLTAELQRAIASALPRNKDFDVYNTPSLLQACKLLDLLLTVAPDEFQMHEWLFITDTVEAVYRPSHWDPIALVDDLAEDLGADIIPPTPAAEVPPTRQGRYKAPLLVPQQHVAEMRKEDFVKKVLGPFFSQLSIHAYESTYSMRAPDLEACEELLLEDLFDDSTIVG